MVTITYVSDVESYKHLLWGCIESRKIWQLYNQFMIQFGYHSTGVFDYSEIFVIESTGLISKLKIRVIQEMIQIVRPSGWTIENIKNILDGLDQMEKYNARVAGR